MREIIQIEDDVEGHEWISGYRAVTFYGQNSIHLRWMFVMNWFAFDKLFAELKFSCKKFREWMKKVRLWWILEVNVNVFLRVGDLVFPKTSQHQPLCLI